MLWWHILFCIISIHRSKVLLLNSYKNLRDIIHYIHFFFFVYIFIVIHFVRSQDEDEESTTVPLSNADDAEDQSVERVPLIIPSRTINNLMSNGSEQNANQV